MTSENSDALLTSSNTDHSGKGNEYGDIAVSGNAVALLGNGTIILHQPLSEAADGHRDGV